MLMLMRQSMDEQPMRLHADRAERNWDRSFGSVSLLDLLSRSGGATDFLRRGGPPAAVVTREGVATDLA